MIDVGRNEHCSLRTDLVRDPADRNPRATLVDEQDLLVRMPVRRHLPAGRQILGSHRERPRSCRPWFHEDLDRATAIFAASEPENLTVAGPNDVVHRSLPPSRMSTPGASGLLRCLGQERAEQWPQGLAPTLGTLHRSFVVLADR